MTPQSASTEVPDASATPSSPTETSSAGLLEELKALWEEIRGLARDHLELASLETKLAAESFVSMMVAGIVMAVLLVTAWLGLLAVCVVFLIALGMGATLSLLLAVLLNIVLAMITYSIIRRKSQDLKWAGTLSSIEARHSGHEDTDTP